MGNYCYSVGADTGSASAESDAAVVLCVPRSAAAPLASTADCSIAPGSRLFKSRLPLATAHLGRPSSLASEMDANRRAVFLRKSLPAAEQRFPLKCVFSVSAAVFSSAAAQPRQPFQ